MPRGIKKTQQAAGVQALSRQDRIHVAGVKQVTNEAIANAGGDLGDFFLYCTSNPTARKALDELIEGFAYEGLRP